MAFVIENKTLNACQKSLSQRLSCLKTIKKQMFNVGSLFSVSDMNNGNNLWVKEFLKSITSNPRLFFLVEIRFIILYYMMKRGY